MIWNLIRDFYVQYIFGGVDSSRSVFEGFFIGGLYNKENPNYYELDTSNFYIPLNGYESIDEFSIDYISFGDWLSTTATIITMIAFVIGIIAFMVWLFKLVGNLIMLRN